MYKKKEIIDLIMIELEKAKRKHPEWPRDIIHASAIICEEAGELIQAALDYCYAPESGNMKAEQWLNIEKEAIQVGAMAIRFLTELYNDKI